MISQLFPVGFTSTNYIKS